MIPRRHLLGFPALGGMLALLEPREAEAAPLADAPQQLTDRSLDGLVRAIDSVRDEMRTERTFAELQRVRTAQKDHLRINAKLPDFIELGVDVWFEIYDWHIRWQQPLTLGRDAGGRYTMVLIQTLLILRSDFLASYVGVPFDNPR